MWWTRERRRAIDVAGRVEPRERFKGEQDERRLSPAMPLDAPKSNFGRRRLAKTGCRVRQNHVVLTPVAGAKSAVASSDPTGIEQLIKSADDGDKTNSSPRRA